MRRASRRLWRAVLDNGMLIVLGGLAYAVALDHVIAVADWAGQPGWKAAALGGSVELLALSAIREIYVRRKANAPIKMPVFCILLGAAMSMACNLEASGPNALSGPPGRWVQVMAVWPVVCALAVATCKATRKAVSVSVEVVGSVDRQALPDQPLQRPVYDYDRPIGPEPAPPPTYRTKKEHLYALVSALPPDDPRSPAQLAGDLAPVVGLDPGTARRYMGELAAEKGVLA